MQKLTEILFFSQINFTKILEKLQKYAMIIKKTNNERVSL